MSMLFLLSNFQSDTLDRGAVTQCVTDLFSRETSARISQYFSDRGGVGALDQAEVHVGTAYRRSRDIGAPEAEALIGRVDSVLAFFDSISGDLYDANRKLRTFVARLDAAVKTLALEHKQTALRDDTYAQNQYAKDMERVNLYRDA